jgi:adenylosuccinate synthase
MIKHADVVIGLSYGDEGKGKVTNELLKKNEYTHCVRYNGGHNAGHTIHKEDKIFSTHVIPTGYLQDVQPVIGPGCVVSPRLLEEEYEHLVTRGFRGNKKIFIDKRVNIISAEHLNEDSNEVSIGTTRRGNGPAYRDKYARKNLRFGDFKTWKTSFFEVVDIYEELHGEKECTVLMEGAQAFGLDIDWGDYPYVTSSHCGVAGAIQNSIPYNKIRNVYGVAKAYDTYVGSKTFEKDEPVFKKIREVGQEFGTTTGRPRQVGFLDLDLLVRSAKLNGVTHVVINKVDILEEVGTWKLVQDKQTVDLENKIQFTRHVSNYLFSQVETMKNIFFSESPKQI